MDVIGFVCLVCWKYGVLKPGLCSWLEKYHTTGLHTQCRAPGSHTQCHAPGSHTQLLYPWITHPAPCPWITHPAPCPWITRLAFFSLLFIVRWNLANLPVAPTPLEFTQENLKSLCLPAQDGFTDPGSRLNITDLFVTGH